MRGSSKLTDEVRTAPLKNGRLLSGEERHARLPGSRLPPVPQYDDGGHQPGRRLGKDHAINCGVCGRRVIAAGLAGKGLQWHGSMDPEVWANRLWDFASEGVDSLTMAEGDRRREESRVVAAAHVVHYAPGDSPLCGLEDSPGPMTPDPELVRGCGDCLELVAEDLADRNRYMGRCLHCNQEIHANGGVAWRRAVRNPSPHCGKRGLLTRPDGP